MSLGRSILFVLATQVYMTQTAPAADESSYTRTEDVIYGRKYGTALTLDVFKPKHHGNGLGVILVVSGGWLSSHEAILPAAVMPLANRGYTVLAVVHGSQPKFTIPEILQDMNRAVRFIRFHARDYGIDPERIGICGASAGGHLSLMQGTAGDEGDPKAKDPVDRISSRVQAVACFVPPTDFLNYGKPGEVALGTGVLKDFPAPFDFHRLDPGRKKFVPVVDENERLELGRRISPINHVSTDDPPTLIIHGDADKLVPIQQSELIVEKLREAGVVAKLVVKPGADHVWPEILKDIGQFADWFDEHLKKGDRRGPANSSAEIAAPGTSSARSAQRREVKSVILEGTPFNRGMVHGRALRGEIHELVGLWKRDLARQFRVDADEFIRKFLAGTDYLPSIKK